MTETRVLEETYQESMTNLIIYRVDVTHLRMLRVVCTGYIVRYKSNYCDFIFSLVPISVDWKLQEVETIYCQHDKEQRVDICRYNTMQKTKHWETRAPLKTVEWTLMLCKDTQSLLNKCYPSCFSLNKIEKWNTFMVICDTVYVNQVMIVTKNFSFHK